MKLPGFLAEASLYNGGGRYVALSGLYGSSGQMAGWSLPTVNAITAAKMAEDIEVFGCRPGHIQLGEGPNMTCINPSDPFGTGGHDGGGTGPGGDGPGGDGGGGVRTLNLRAGAAQPGAGWKFKVSCGDSSALPSN